jgi:dihydrofolate reductase
MNASTREPSPALGSWTLVVAVARNGVIGRGGTLPWRLRSDLQRFKRMTMGHCLLMGRKTYDSIGRALPGRQTIVVSRSGLSEVPTGVKVVGRLSDVPRHVEPGREVMVVGGAQVYKAALDYCSTLWLTRVLADVDGDTYLPAIDWDAWRLESVECFDAGENDQWPTEFQIWHRAVDR